MLNQAVPDNEHPQEASLNAPVDRAIADYSLQLSLCMSQPASHADEENDGEIRVFVYGTLKPGGCNYLRYCQGHVTGEFDAIAYGTLYHLPVGYPAMTVGDRPVCGVVLCLDQPSTLYTLDILEDYDPRRLPDENEYNRRKIEIFDLQGISQGQVWAYLMSHDNVIRHGGRELPAGTWHHL